MTTSSVCEFLKSNSDFLENWILDEIELETLERWTIRKAQRQKGKVDENNANVSRKTSLSRWKFCVHADKRKMLQELTNSLQHQPKQDNVLWELSQCIYSAVNSDGFHLYLVQPPLIRRYQPTNISQEQSSTWSTNLDDSRYICNWVAHSKEPIRFSGALCDTRFKECSPFFSTDVYHFLVMPIIQTNGVLLAILELYRNKDGEEFHEEDEEIVNSYLVWGGIALHYSELYNGIAKQRKLNDFMLSVVRSIFQDMVSMDTVITKVMNFAQSLVDADRASLFLLDSKSNQLYARIFDIGLQTNEDEYANASKEIRFAVGTGIAGIVAETGEIMNIPDAYSDPRFNRNIDQMTGYVTKNILCMPIFIQGHVIGVMQMVNKATGHFNKNDEESFQFFASYCGLALHHAKLYDKIRKSEQKYKVALEIMSYHSNCSNEDYNQLCVEEIPDAKPHIDEFYFSSLEVNGLNKVRDTMYMFVDLFGLDRFDKDCLLRFCLTVRKNYRRIPYHNWTHGFGVANTMYAILKHSPTTFKPLECLSLFVGALCHDLDHRGKNNKFLLETDSPLSAIYTTSTLEHHHFNQTVTILQQEGHNIFSKLTSFEYKQVLGNVKHCILATDLGLFFPNREKLNSLIETNSFSWETPEHRMILQSIVMTGCDLGASTKPWEDQKKTVEVIFEEFYEQGDAERVAGRNPIPMMDRTKPGELPSSQVGFLSGICIPCYDLMAKLIPGSSPLLDGCKSNFQKWKAMSNSNTSIKPPQK